MFGEITISGAKNAAVAIIPAALLVDGVCRIENIPQISDVTLLFTILEDMGAKVKVLNQHAVQIDCHSVHSTQPCYDLARKIRASYYLLGALLGRFGEATVAMPGGCNFGVRPIDQHVKGFRAMGADVTEGNLVHATARGGRLKGATVYLDVVSVGATMNIMMAAVLADGVTTIENAAKEPHIVDLANFLNSMGADIKGAGTDVHPASAAWRSSPAAATASSPTRSRPVPTWPPWPPRAVRCSSRTSSPSTWTASPPSSWRWAFILRSRMTRSSCAAASRCSAPT